MTSSGSELGSLILHRVNVTGKEIGHGAYGRVFEVDYEAGNAAFTPPRRYTLCYCNMHKEMIYGRL